MDAQSVVVIGSGPSGAMAAHELVHQGVPVTLLESGASEPSGLLVRAGGRNLFRKTPELHNEPDYVTSGHPSTAWYRTLQPGGLSNQWTGAVPRFAPGDFSDGQRLHERYRWPLDYEHLEPFYQRAERLLGIERVRGRRGPTAWRVDRPPTIPSARVGERGRGGGAPGSRPDTSASG